MYDGPTVIIVFLQCLNLFRGVFRVVTSPAVDFQKNWRREALPLGSVATTVLGMAVVVAMTSPSMLSAVSIRALLPAMDTLPFWGMSPATRTPPPPTRLPERDLAQAAGSPRAGADAAGRPGDPLRHSNARCASAAG